MVIFLMGLKHKFDVPKLDISLNKI